MIKIFRTKRDRIFIQSRRTIERIGVRECEREKRGRRKKEGVWIGGFIRHRG